METNKRIDPSDKLLCLYLKKLKMKTANFKFVSLLGRSSTTSSPAKVLSVQSQSVTSKKLPNVYKSCPK